MGWINNVSIKVFLLKRLMADQQLGIWNNPRALFKRQFLKKDEITDALLIQLILTANMK